MSAIDHCDDILAVEQVSGPVFDKKSLSAPPKLTDCIQKATPVQLDNSTDDFETERAFPPIPQLRLATGNGTVTPCTRTRVHREQEAFVKTLPTHQQLIVNTKFGKPTLNRCFHLEASLSHTFLPLLRSNFLAPEDYYTMAEACHEFSTLIELL